MKNNISELLAIIQDIYTIWTGEEPSPLEVEALTLRMEKALQKTSK